MGVVSLSPDAFDSAVSSVASSSAKIHCDRPGKVSAAGCSGIAIEKYIETAEEIASLMKMYRALLEKDVARFSRNKESLVTADESLAGG